MMVLNLFQVTLNLHFLMVKYQIQKDENIFLVINIVILHIILE